MKTVLLISRCPPYPIHYGDRLIIWHVARELVSRGYTIDLLALYDQDDDPAHVEAYQAYFRHIDLIQETPRSSMSYLRRLLVPKARFPQSADDSFTPKLWHAISTYLERYTYDVVHCFGGISVYEFYALFADKPTIITPYESYALYLQRAIQHGDWKARLMLPIARAFERWMFTPYDRTVVIAEPDKALLQTIQPQLNIDIIPNGIDLNDFQQMDIPRDLHTLLFVGNYDYLPNQDAVRVLVEQILPRVHEVLPRVKLQLVGNHPPPWMQALASDHIEITGRVPNVQPYLAQGTVFVCPLRIGAGLKNKVLEALAMGIPVVGTPLSMDGIHVVHGESAWVADVEQIAEGVVTLLHDVGLQRRLSVAGRALIEAQYSWARTAERYDALYDEVIALHQ